MKYKEILDDDDDNGEPIITLSDSLETFASNQEFDDFTDDLDSQFDELIEEDFETGVGDLGEAPTASEDLSKDTITNVQEVGVDEGDIVKAYADYLVVLRRGSLFSIKLEDEDSEVLEPISKVDAFPEGFTQGTWYDEMLIYKNTIIVIGYSYDMSATEIEIFTINGSGKITHDSAYFIDSNDYYSSRNYASRLIGNELILILYMPYYLFSWDYVGEDYKRVVALPQIKEWIQENETTDGENILSKTDIYKPIQNTTSPTLHTIVRCDLDSSSLDCSAKAILGPYSRNFYVSTNAIYLWISEGYDWWYLEEDSEEDDEKADSYVYQFLLEDDTARALIADGTPIDQFSFKETDDHLNVLVRENSAGDAMWNPEVTAGELALFRTSLENFTNEPKTVSINDFTSLPTPEGYTSQNRFAGDYLLYGTGSNWYYDETSENTLYIKNYTNRSDIQQIDLTHTIDRIEVMGDGAVVVGVNGDDLKLSSVELANNSEIKNTFTMENAMQGETRSHVFFYKSNNDDTGIIGLPIRREGESYEQLFNESAEVLFLRVNADKQFYNLGTLEANPPTTEDDDCFTSCVDWYGNSRPIFYGDRIFGLMGYEMVEGKVVDA
jgi:hypothetical protein